MEVTFFSVSWTDFRGFHIHSLWNSDVLQ
uniref:Uncharacterized protein n=1 Tax=Anguilla anguilla TaxID=7936 RepID=A0A0E9UX16_ANGAN